MPVYYGLCDSSRLAELTGITVVDNFPARELTVGGNGQNLESLPFWLAFADRSPTVSTQTRIVVDTDNEITTYVLPPSDGLDADVPGIEVFKTSGLAIPLGLLLSQFPDGQLSHSECHVELSRLYLSGKSSAQLIANWSEFESSGHVARTKKWLNTAKQLIASGASDLDSAVHTAFEIIANELSVRLEKCPPIDQVLITTPGPLHGCMVNLLDEIVPGVDIESHSSGVEGEGLACLSAAILGLMHIDQLPANLPWVTGADYQRILGGLTPGRPANWRQLVLDMADYCPPAMKLRDAV